MKVERVELAAIKANKANPRVCRDAKFKKLVDSILAFPKMMEARPIVVNGEMVVLGGNQRLKALQTIKGMDIAEVRGRITRQSDFASKSKAEQDEILSYWAVWLDKPIVSIVNAKEFSDSEQKQFIIKDNASAGEWDFAALAEGYDSTVLSEWSVDVPSFSFGGSPIAPAPNPAVYTPSEVSDIEVDNDTPAVTTATALPDIPPELAGGNYAPAPLPEIKAEGSTIMERVIITYLPSQAEAVARLLGLEKLTKVVYEFKEITERQGVAE